MNPQPQPPNGDRLDRIERALEGLAQSDARLARRVETLLDMQGDASARQQRHNDAIAPIHEEHARFRTDLRELLTAQVFLTDNQRQADAKLKQFGEETDRRLRELAEAQQHTDANLNALIAVVDDIVRKRPPQSGSLV